MYAGFIQQEETFVSVKKCTVITYILKFPETTKYSLSIEAGKVSLFACFSLVLGVIILLITLYLLLLAICNECLIRYLQIIII